MLPEIEAFEPYIDEEGGIGFVIAMPGTPENPGRIEVKSLNEWKAQDEKLGEALEQQARKLIKIFRFPSKPLVDDDDDDLQTDIVRCLAEHIWIQDGRYYSALGNAVICSWIRDLLATATRPCFYGPTKTGKSRALKCMANLCYRGFNGINPTGPSLFRMIERYHVTVCIDESQGIQDEQKADVNLIVKGGFEDGPGVPRVNEKGELDFFQVYSSMILGAKRVPPEEDVQNRCLLICMSQKPPNSELGDRTIRRKIDLEGMERLRGRLLAFRLRVMSGAIDTQRFIKEAEEMAEKPILINGKEVDLDDRSADKAAELLVPGIIFKDCDGTLELLAQSENDANEGLLETFEAKGFYALQAVYAPVSMKGDIIKVCDPKTISIRDVKDQLATDLSQAGDEDEPPNTRAVGRILRLLGFRFKQGHGRASMFDPDFFQQAYSAGIRKYGYRGGGEDAK